MRLLKFTGATAASSGTGNAGNAGRIRNPKLNPELHQTKPTDNRAIFGSHLTSQAETSSWTLPLPQVRMMMCCYLLASSCSLCLLSSTFLCSCSSRWGKVKVQNNQLYCSPTMASCFSIKSASLTSLISETGLWINVLVHEDFSNSILTFTIGVFGGFNLRNAHFMYLLQSD